MAHVTIVICDECQRAGIINPRIPVEQYSIQSGALRAITHLCDDHATYLRNILIGSGRDESEVRTTIDESRILELVRTMDEIRQAKKRWLKYNPPT